MKQVTLVQFRKNAETILRRIERGERLVLTRHGCPVARLEPISEASPASDDPIYRLAELAVEGPGKMSNQEMDRIIYG